MPHRTQGCPTCSCQTISVLHILSSSRRSSHRSLGFSRTSQSDSLARKDITTRSTRTRRKIAAPVSANVSFQYQMTRLIAALLLVFALYCAWAAYDMRSFTPLVSALLAAVVAVGLLLARRMQSAGSWSSIIKPLAVVFAAYAVYSVWTAIESSRYDQFIGSAISAAAAIGLWLRKSWSQYVVYLITSVFVFLHLWVAWALVSEAWPYRPFTQQFGTAFPHLCIAALGIGCSIFVFKGLHES